MPAIATEAPLRPGPPPDNVAIVVNDGGLPAGTHFDSGLTLTEPVPEAHKVALTDIPAGAPHPPLRSHHRLRAKDPSRRQLGTRRPRRHPRTPPTSTPSP